MKRKKCSICNKNRLLKFYSKNYHSKDGLRPDCKSCGKLSLEDRNKLKKKFKVKHEKKCSKCKKYKNYSEFYKRNNDKYLVSACKICYQKLNRDNKIKHNYYKDKQKEYNKTEKRKFQWFKADIKKKYGITHDEYLKILKRQNEKCLICEAKNSDNGGILHLDHCHKTNKIRGFLCRSCNHGIGNFKDDIKLLKKAIEYLKLSNN